MLQDHKPVSCLVRDPESPKVPQWH